MGTAEQNRTSGLKSLLLRAWRERWSDVQWSIAVKRLLNPQANENQHLADLLLHQALIGSSPNLLVLTYLRHAMATQMVSFSAAFRSIIKFDDVNKPFCVRSLLEVVENFAPKISGRGVSEDSLELATSLLLVLKWLYNLVYKCTQKLNEDKQSSEHGVLAEKCCDVIDVLISTKPSRAMLYVARLEDPDTYSQIEELKSDVQNLMSASLLSQINSTVKDKLEDAVNMLSLVDQMPVESSPMLDISHQPVNLTLNALLTLEAVLNPTNPIEPFVEQIQVVQATQGLSNREIYCELLRNCFLGLIDASGSQDELKWAAFTFLKMPQILVKLVKNKATDENKLRELYKGMEMLLNYTALLDLVDTKCKSDCLNHILQELSNKHSLLEEGQCKSLLNRRQLESQRSKASEQTSSGQSPCSLILRAEPTVASILKTLDADYSKNQEALLGVLHHMLSGKSFELILAAAAATGKLQSFVVKLIKFNEFAKQTSGEASKGAQTRALLFDISFLMLCHIMQLYGTEIMSTAQESSKSFFAQWASQCLPEDGKYKSLELQAPPDSNKVEVLLGQFGPEGELKMSLTRWHEVCHNAPHAILEVLHAWEAGALTADAVKGIMDNVKGKMCSLPVVVSASLCSYINLLEEEARRKPLNILQQLMKSIPSDPANQYYAERSNLMMVILNRMITEVLPASSTRHKSTYSLPLSMPAQTMLLNVFRETFSKSCMDLHSVHKLENLLGITGPQWFTHQLVKEVLTHDRVEDLNKAISLVFAVFYIDIENLSVCLLHYTVPQLLHMSEARMSMLTDPRGRSLAKLCVMCLMALYKLRSYNRESSSSTVSPAKRGKKRARADYELDSIDESCEDLRPPSKMRKLPGQQESPSCQNDSFNFAEMMAIKENGNGSIDSSISKDSMQKTIGNLFRLFSSLLSGSQVSQRMGFITAFIEETLKCDRETSQFILQFMPVNMVSQLLKCMPNEFSTELLLAMCDLKSSTGRKVACKAIAQNAKFQSTAVSFAARQHVV